MPCRLDNNLFLALHIDCIARQHVHVNRSLIHTANTCQLVVATPAMTYHKPLELDNLVHIMLCCRGTKLKIFAKPSFLIYWVVNLW